MRRSRRKAMRAAGAVLLACLIGMAAFFVWAWRASRRVPDFYVAALMAPREELARSGQELVQEFQQLQSDVHREGTWQAVFTEKEINGWLAVELPARHPDLLPQQLTDPRVEIGADRARVAARYESGKFRSVLYVSVAVTTRDGDNVVAVTLLEARAGALPVPLRSVTRHIDRAAERLKIEIQWEEDDQGRPVAVFTVPLPASTQRFDVRIDKIVLQSEQVIVYGRTRRVDSFLGWLKESRQSDASSSEDVSSGDEESTR